MSARIHTHTSNRAKPPPRAPPENKVVFKSVLESPYRIHWPSVPLNLQNTILARLLSVLEGVSEYNSARDKAHRDGKRVRRDSSVSRTKKKLKAHDGIAVQNDGISDLVVDNPSADTVAIHPKPPILEHVIVGINEVTRRLESQIRGLRTAVKVSSEGAHSLSDSRREIKVVFVCRDDIDPPFSSATFLTSSAHITLRGLLNLSKRSHSQRTLRAHLQMQWACERRQSSHLTSIALRLTSSNLYCNRSLQLPRLG
ncbi:RNase P and RNase MRP subunit [Pleurotus ostreatus]|nr:RNase P and RNase MRP subunit [Pleurotus ostreatus]